MISFLPLARSLRCPEVAERARRRPASLRPATPLRLALICADSDHAQDILRSLGETAPALEVAVVDDLHAVDGAGDLHPPADIVLLRLADALDATGCPRAQLVEPSAPAAIVLHATGEETAAERLIAAGVQECVSLSDLAATDWDTLLRRACLRQECRRHAWRSDLLAPALCGDPVETALRDCLGNGALPALLWLAEPGGPVRRLDDRTRVGAHPALTALERRMATWVTTLRAEPTALPEDLRHPLPIEENGATRYFLPVATELREPEPRRWVFLLVDATALVDGQHTTQDDLGSARHALRSPLTAIVMSARIAAQGKCDPLQSEMWQIVLDSARQLEGLIGECLGDAGCGGTVSAR